MLLEPVIVKLGFTVTVKSALLVPEIDGLLVSVKPELPVFKIVNVLTIVPDAVDTDSKSVSLVVEVAVVPLTIERAFP